MYLSNVPTIYGIALLVSTTKNVFDLEHVPLVQPIAQSPNSFLQKANLHTRA